MIGPSKIFKLTKTPKFYSSYFTIRIIKRLSSSICVLGYLGTREEDGEVLRILK